MTLKFGLSSGKSLTFPNVVTRTKTQLEASGTVVPFIQLVTSDGTDNGNITAVKYKFMRRVSSTEWAEATDQEVELIVNDNGAYAAFYVGAKDNPQSVTIPRQASGSVSWSGSSATPKQICSMAISYDDKLGLRIFAGNVAPATGVATCN